MGANIDDVVSEGGGEALSCTVPNSSIVSPSIPSSLLCTIGTVYRMPLSRRGVFYMSCFCGRNWNFPTIVIRRVRVTQGYGDGRMCLWRPFWVSCGDRCFCWFFRLFFRFGLFFQCLAGEVCARLSLPFSFTNIFRYFSDNLSARFPPFSSFLTTFSEIVVVSMLSTFFPSTPSPFFSSAFSAFFSSPIPHTLFPLHLCSCRFLPLQNFWEFPCPPHLSYHFLKSFLLFSFSLFTNSTFSLFLFTFGFSGSLYRSF